MVGDQRQDARERLIATLRQGLPWREATREAVVTMGRRTAYRFLGRVRAEGEAAAVRCRCVGRRTVAARPSCRWHVAPSLLYRWPPETRLQ